MSKFVTRVVADKDVKVGQQFVTEDGRVHAIEKVDLTQDGWMVWAGCAETQTHGWHVKPTYNVIVEDDISGVQNYNPNNYKTMTTAVWNVQAGQSFMGKDGRVYLIDRIIHDGPVCIVNAITEGIEGTTMFRDETYDVIMKDPNHTEPATGIIGSLMQSAAIAGDCQVPNHYQYKYGYYPERLWTSAGYVTEKRINLIQDGFTSRKLSHEEAAIIITTADLYEEKCADTEVFKRLDETVMNAVQYHSDNRHEMMSSDMFAFLMISLGIKWFALMESIIASGKVPKAVKGESEGNYEIIEFTGNM